MDVQGKTAVITGGGSGIGRGIARCLAANGMNIVVADIEQAPLDEVVAELEAAGTAAIGVRADVSDLSQVQALADAAVGRFDSVEVLCNNAGVGLSAPIAQTSIEDWRWTLDIDLWGPIHGVHVFLPLMDAQGEGHINSTASMAGLYCTPSLGAYNVAKHGVVALMATLERDLRLANSKVRASVLCPGPIDTNIVDSQRNREPASAAEHIETEAGEKFWNLLTRSLAEGMDPDDVGPLILDAVVNQRFWILTHPDMARVTLDQATTMLEDRTLTR